MPNLVLWPISQPTDDKDYVLRLRYHDCVGETEYVDITRVSTEMAKEIEHAGAAYFMFDHPDSLKEAW